MKRNITTGKVSGKHLNLSLKLQLYTHKMETAIKINQTLEEKKKSYRIVLLRKMPYNPCIEYKWNSS